MTTRFWLYALTAIALACAAPATEPEAVTDPCDTWNTEGFFKRATPEGVASCLQAGKSVSARNDDNQSPICMAAQFNSDPGVIKVLVQHGAFANDSCEFNNWLRSGFCSAMTVLHIAAMYIGNPDVIQALIDAGAQVNAVAGANRTPLNMAYLWGNTGAADVLRRHGGTTRESDPGLCGG